ncbi:metallophosphoesterase [Anaerobacillus alkaliphilus]|uniref:Metallophosphoesterase n=2 Tax=Anaerobacillus alkaliphilus TaxID=1548597 RepID=A0A4Q0VY28_9BACI|nr:metallophosphoesterase [Anaerobacillus alkaliphilus]
MWLEARKNKITYTELAFSSYPKNEPNMKLFFISDVHHRKISEKIISEIKGNVDLIVIGGDLAEKGVPLSKIEENLKALTAIAPTYFVWGNNDYEIDHLKLETMLKNEGVVQLVNSSKMISNVLSPIYLIGVDDYGHHFDNLEEALKNCNGGFQILISHNPDIKKKIRENHQISLILSGHTHGGQIRLFGWGITEKAGFTKLKKDLYMLVSNGYGTTRLHLRMGAPAEAHVITLRSI